MKFSLFMMPCHQPGDNPTLAFQRDIGLSPGGQEQKRDEKLARDVQRRLSFKHSVKHGVTEIFWFREVV